MAPHSWWVKFRKIPTPLDPSDCSLTILHSVLREGCSFPQKEENLGGPWSEWSQVWWSGGSLVKLVQVVQGWLYGGSKSDVLSPVIQSQVVQVVPGLVILMIPLLCRPQRPPFFLLCLCHGSSFSSPHLSLEGHHDQTISFSFIMALVAIVSPLSIPSAPPWSSTQLVTLWCNLNLCKKEYFVGLLLAPVFILVGNCSE